MFNTVDLLEVAFGLTSSGRDTLSRNRRAVSTAYYTLFHHVLNKAALRFMGPGTAASAGYRLIYRAFDHSSMRDVCQQLDKKVLSNVVQQRLGRTALDPVVRAFAKDFVDLQQARLTADYDPSATFSEAAARNWVNTAVQAISSFDSIPPDEQTDIFALMMVRSRG